MPLQCVAGRVWQASLVGGERPRVQPRSQRDILDYGPGPPPQELTPCELFRAPGTPGLEGRGLPGALLWRP